MRVLIQLQNIVEKCFSACESKKCVAFVSKIYMKKPHTIWHESTLERPLIEAAHTLSKQILATVPNIGLGVV